MRLVRKEVSAKDGDGFAVLCAADGEDMWHAYNLILVGDLVTASTIRKVVQSTQTLVSTQRLRINLTVRVVAVDFDPRDCVIRLSGRNTSESEHVKLGAFHTLELEPHRNFTVRKQCWDTIFLERLDLACNPARQATVAAVVMQQGLAHVCLISGSMTLVRAKVEKSIPKKRAGGKSHEEGQQRFFELVLQALLREVDFEQIKVVLLASPGFVKDDFFKYALEQAGKRSDLKHVARNKGMFVLVHAASGYKDALDQVLADPGLQSQLLDTQAAKEVAALHRFFRMLNDSSDKAFYSLGHVRAALDKGAVESLLVTDSLFRSSDIATRKRYVQLVEDARAAGAKVFVFSALHPSGEQLNQLSGVAAILRYALPELDDLEVEDAPQVAAKQERALDLPPAFEDADADADDGAGQSAFYDDDAGAGDHERPPHSSLEASLGIGLAAHHQYRTRDDNDADAAVREMFDD